MTDVLTSNTLLARRGLQHLFDLVGGLLDQLIALGTSEVGQRTVNDFQVREHILLHIIHKLIDRSASVHSVQKKLKKIRMYLKNRACPVIAK